MGSPRRMSLTQTLRSNSNPQNSYSWRNRKIQTPKNFTQQPKPREDLFRLQN